MNHNPDYQDSQLYKIRQAQIQRVPYMLIVGDNEQDAQQISVRLRSGEDLGMQAIDAFEAIALEAVANKS